MKDAKGNDTKTICGLPPISGSNNNIGSLFTHCRGHWSFTTPKPESTKACQAPNQKGIKGFWKVTLQTKRFAGSGGNTSDLACKKRKELDLDKSDAAAEVADLTVDVPAVQNNNLDERADKPVELEYVPCGGRKYNQFPGREFPIGFDFSTSYSFQMHGPASTAMKNTNFAPKLIWSVESLGYFRSDACGRIVKRDKNDDKIIKKTTLDGSAILAACHGIAFKRDVNNIL